MPLLAKDGMKATAEDAFPVEVEALLASLFEFLKEQGAAREIAILLNSDVHGFQSSYDNWDGGTYGWSLRFEIEIDLYSRLSEVDLHEAAQIICKAAAPFLRKSSNHHFEQALLGPRATKNERWREQASAYLSGAGITNQGRVRSDNIASRQVDGLLFRSQPEIHLYRALKSLGVTFAPLPVFLRGGASYARLEPDFVILKDGLVMVVEVDGDTYHRESPVDAHQRLSPLDHEGAKIERVRADECGSPEDAKACAARLMKVLDRRAARR